VGFLVSSKPVMTAAGAAGSKQGADVPGWRVTNFGPGPVPLPAGTVILTSSPSEGPQLPADTTAWLTSG